MYVWKKAWVKNCSLKNIGIQTCSKSTKCMSKMSYSVSGPDSNFAINSASTFDPIFSEFKSESDDSESDYNVYESRHLCFFYPIFAFF